ncbi:DUF2267 domain-containing protein [Nocardia otitidiscaviarum]|uniref:DUF2267 domain-containing protein n=1 Tax=Nocardia otitidiscaviarum TaxID=1823 RepID=UPI0024564E3E|nr:DUF2267 domain-containing protein [Nocardia otitidiscaviarum]
MRHDEFIGQVQARAQLPDRGAAGAATRATLETLAERIPDTLAVKLAAQLPGEIGENLLRVTETGTGLERFGREEFIARVAERAHTSHTGAVARAQAVLELIDEATTGAMPEKLRDALPPDLRTLLDDGSSPSSR